VIFLQINLTVSQNGLTHCFVKKVVACNVVQGPKKTVQQFQLYIKYSVFQP